MASVAEFPVDGATGPEIKQWAQRSIAAAGALGELPVWTLPESGNATPASLRLRRAALLFLLALPGTVRVDAAAERALQGSAVPHPFDVDEVLRRSSTWHSFFGGGRDAHPGQDVYWQDYYELRGSTDVLVFSGSRRGWGAMIIANFATESCRVTDGMICAASDNPYGERDLTSDNDFLPAVTTIWLAAK